MKRSELLKQIKKEGCIFLRPGKRRHFCPSCHAKRVAEFGEFASSNVLKNVPHRHFVFLST